MALSAVRPTDDEITDVVNTYSSMLFKLCFSMLGSYADAEDAVSDTIIRYINKCPSFKDDNHQKAWLLKTASNVCKDKLRFRIRHNHVNIDDICEMCNDKQSTDIIECLLKIPEKYRCVIYLFYIEGYKTDEIAKILDVSPSAVRKRLQYGRKLLKLEYERNDSL